MRRATIANVLLIGAVLFLGSAVVVRVRRGDSPLSHPTSLAAGERIESFWLDLGWDAPPGGPTLVVFFTVECPWCRISVKRWNALHEITRRILGARAVAVSLSDSVTSREYPAQTGLDLPLHIPPPGRFPEERWRITAVPYTVLLEPSGRVRGAWGVALDSTLYDSIKTLLIPEI